MTGTDTGVGKTTVAAMLCAGLRQVGPLRRFTAIKPIETGCKKEESGLVAADAQLLRERCGLEDENVFYRFQSPVAPFVAAEAEGGLIDIPWLLERIEQARSSCDLLVVEGAGGLMVPITPAYTYADLAADCGAAVLVVVGSRLGALNHALLTFHALRAKGLEVVGYVLNHPFDNRPEAAAGIVSAQETNRQALAACCKPLNIPEICAIPYSRHLHAGAASAGGAGSGIALTLANAAMSLFNPTKPLGE